ncbi:MAG: PIG-L family deacetylase [Kiritimatiellae bacterium]|nr:PIG-L family deacetylase [Kiritimatiellia bacterium]MDD5522573.1 PIG-L family deacetylase [Kiritimatiellia bacterium]
MQSDFQFLFDGKRPLFFHDLNLPATLRIAVLAPHPDDFDAIGVTMRMLRDNGNQIDVAVLTSGASGVDDDFGADLTIQDKAALREKEQYASCQFFGLPDDKLTFLRLDEDQEGHPEVSEQNLYRLRTYWVDKQSDLVFLPHGNDTNLGHQRTYIMFCQLIADEPKPLMALLNRDPKTLSMRQDLYTLFGTSEAVWKGQLLRFHQTQHQRNLKTRHYGMDERILQINRKIAEELGNGAEYAEVFEIKRYTGTGEK